MSRFLPAYDPRTGRKLPHYVPEHWFDHPVIGKTVRRTPKSAAAKKKNTNPPADGENNPEKEQ